MTRAPETAATTRTAMFTGCWPGNVTGRWVIQPWSLRNAITLPAKETDPMRPPATASAR